MWDFVPFMLTHILMILSTHNPDQYFSPTRDNVSNTNDSVHRAPTSQNGIKIFNNLLPPSHASISEEKDKLEVTWKITTLIQTMLKNDL